MTNSRQIAATSDLKVLVVDDHNEGVGTFETYLGKADPFDGLAEPPKRGGFKWVREAETAVRLLEAQVKAENGWSPDCVLVDYEMLGQRASGLSALVAVRKYAPAARVAIYSSASTTNGRTLFTSAARHWLGVTVEVSKSNAAVEVPKFLEDSLGQHGLSQNNSHLIDELFWSEHALAIYRELVPSLGSYADIAKVCHLSEKTIYNRINVEMKPRVEKYAASVMNAHLPSSATGQQRSRFLYNFAYSGSHFFNDPALPELLADMRPWKHQCVSPGEPHPSSL